MDPSNSKTSLIILTPQGLYCPLGKFYIDPWEPVDCAVLTHAHSDHARSGSKVFHAADSSRLLLLKRLGPEAKLCLHPYRETFYIGPVRVSLHPAGHILGSAQVRVEHEGEVWVVSGDYKRQADATCEPFEQLQADVLITEATFGLPIYTWPETEDVAYEVFKWWQENRKRGRNSLLACYALGKAQRLLSAMRSFTNEAVYTHGATESLVEAYRAEGIELLPTIKVSDEHKKLAGELILAPPAALASPWAKRFDRAAQGFASGWMQIRGNRRRRGYDKGFVLSDHADWPGLLKSIFASSAQKIYVTHGYAEELARYLGEQGLNAEPLSTLFQGEGDS